MLQPPRLIRWILLVSLFLLGAMSLLRALIFWTFASDEIRLVHAWDTFLLGFRFDVRVVAALALTVMTLGLVAEAEPVFEQGGCGWVGGVLDNRPRPPESVLYRGLPPLPLSESASQRLGSRLPRGRGQIVRDGLAVLSLASHRGPGNGGDGRRRVAGLVRTPLDDEAG